ncbi:nuclear transport factor 2 family protein [Litorilituus lipolyticus]|uniref:nuclear transport factor 2 family protein n=1 Tax=Litorilituus lipolyticus TaxID=2491017 RepID=UPI00319DFCE5
MNSYFKIYQQRSDFKSFMSFYHEQAQFEDIVYGNHLKHKTDIKAFLNWQRGEFSLLNSDRLFTINHQTIDEQTVTTQGYFHQFSYDGQVLGPWLFVMVHEFDSQHKIIKQTDWINYTPRENYLGGVNMNKVLIP